MKNILSVKLLLITSILVGCFHGSSSDTEELDKLEGVWEPKNTGSPLPPYVTFSNNAMSYQLYEPLYDCFSLLQTLNYSISGNEISISSNGTVGNQRYEIVGDTLKLYDPNGNLVNEFLRSSLTLSEFSNTCSDETVTGSITISMELLGLPSSVIINRATSVVDDPDFVVSATLDVNANGVIDSGDVKLEIYEYKKEGESETSNLISELRPYLAYYISSSQLVRDIPIDLLVNGNTIEFSVPRSIHKSVANIEQGVQAMFYSFYRFSATETQSDVYPGSDSFTTGLDTTSLQDATDDYSGGSVAYIDIRNISVLVAN